MTDDAQRLRRWRLILGGSDAEKSAGIQLTGDDLLRDRALAALYGDCDGRRGGMEGSAPRVARWLGDVRECFPTSVVRVIQRDAMQRLSLDQLLLEPEMLEAVEPDVHLVGTLLSLTDVILCIDQSGPPAPSSGPSCRTSSGASRSPRARP